MGGNPPDPIVGVLSLQGDVAEHIQALKEDSSVQVRPVWTPSDLNGLAGLVIPGGESTTITKLALRFGLFEPLEQAIGGGLPTLATCAGMILVGTGIVDTDQPQLGVMDIVVRRNAFGRQNDSFETELTVTGFERKFPAVFIRAPWVEQTGEEVEVLATVGSKPVLVRQNNIIGAAFHPELTSDRRVHHLFLQRLGSRLN